MAKIPRLDGGSPAASVPGGAIPGASGGDAVAVAGALGNLADVGYKIAADSEATEAAKLQRALEAKQAIVNEVEAGRRAGDYEESLVGYVEGLKKEFWDQPDKAPEQLLEIGRTLADRQLEDAPNSAVGLSVAQRANSRLDGAMREMHNWAQARQTQKAKGDLAVTINRATAAAEGQGSPVALAGYIQSKTAELTPVFQQVLGPAEAESKLADMQQDMARSWTLAAGDRDPIMVLGALDAKNGPLVDHLNVSQREALRNATKASFEGLTKTRELEAVKTGMSSNRKLAEAFASGSPEFAGIAFTQKRALEEQKKAVNAQISYDSAALKKAGIEVPQTGNVVAVIDERIAFIDAIEKARRRQTAYDAPGDPASTDALLLQTDKAIKAKNGKELGLIVAQQKNLAIALSNEKVSGSAAATMFKTMSLAMDKAAENSEDVWGPNTWRAFHAPLESGSVELNRQFAGQFSKLGKLEQQRVRLNYLGQFNSAQEQGTAIDSKTARRMALRALALETGQRIPGVD